MRVRRAALAAAAAAALLALAAAWFSRLESAPRAYAWLRARGIPFPGNPDTGKWHPMPPRDRREDREAQLAALGYLEGYEPAPERRGVTVHVPALAWQGLNLYCSGHAAEALLMDMAGRVLHRWAYAFDDAFPDFPHRREKSAQWWRRVALLEDGGLLAIYEGLGLIRIDRDSRLVWALAGGYHHDLFVGADGRIHVLWRDVRVIPRLHAQEQSYEDFVRVLDSDGRLLHEFSLLEALERSGFASLLDDRPPFGDILHTNTLELLDGRHAGRFAAFAAGNALVSFRSLDTVAVVDLARERLVWARRGPWVTQHQPSLVESGAILVFDNKGLGDRSRVLELDPLTGAIVWSYDREGFSSPIGGSAQRLDNGNTLVSESTAGRAFEVTREGAIAWEFYNPHRAGPSDALIATLLEVVRLPPQRPAWLGAAPAPAAP
jgi:hypothetical protein